jgi:hypothetical protein
MNRIALAALLVAVARGGVACGGDERPGRGGAAPAASAVVLPECNDWVDKTERCLASGKWPAQIAEIMKQSVADTRAAIAELPADAPELSKNSMIGVCRGQLDALKQSAAQYCPGAF